MNIVLHYLLYRALVQRTSPIDPAANQQVELNQSCKFPNLNLMQESYHKYQDRDYSWCYFQFDIHAHNREDPLK